MANQNQKVEEKTEQVNGQVQQQVETPVQAEPQNVQQVAAQPEQKTGFGGWLKKHWKGVTAAITGGGAAVASAVIAYKKGKAAGIMAAPAPAGEPEDYSLNPNE